jgi:hypothetical protein
VLRQKHIHAQQADFCRNRTFTLPYSLAAELGTPAIGTGDSLAEIGFQMGRCETAAGGSMDACI